MKRLKIVLQHDLFYYILLFLVLGLFTLKTIFPHQSIYKNFYNEKFVITNIEEKDYGLKLELKGKEKVLGYLYSDNKINNKNNYLIGDHVIITGEKKTINNNTVLNTFNYKKYLESKKIYNVIDIKVIKEDKKKKSILYRVKQKLINRTNKLKKSKNYINSLLFGDNKGIDEEKQEDYRKIGISHLFAISGLHIGIFLFILNALLNRISISQKKVNIIEIVFILLYMFITNYTASVLRAGLFTILCIINKSLNLNIKTRNLLFLTLFLISINNPLAINNIGLKYSFTVTLFLILLKDIIKGNYIKRLLIISLISFSASYPITAGSFYEINYLSIVYNIFFVPIISFIIMPLILLAYIFPYLDSVLYLMITIIEELSQLLNSIKIGKLIVCKMNCLFYMSYYVVLCVICCKKEKIIVKILTLLLITSLFNIYYPFKEKNHLTVIDVGQGDSTFIKLKSENLLIDTGGIVMYNQSKYTNNLSKNKTIPYLKSLGESQIDTLVLTHGDFDHMGEAKYLVSNFTVKRVIFNAGELNTLEKDLIKILEEKNVKYYQNINELKVDDTKFYFLNTKIYDNENDNSNVIYFEFNKNKFLFMGDAGVEREKDILEKYDINNIDVLKVGHHGSSTSSSKDFINEINPKYSIISVGKNNRYGHPNKEVIDNLKNSKIYRTDEDGSIIFKVKNNKLRIETCSP